MRILLIFLVTIQMIVADFKKVVAIDWTAAEILGSLGYEIAAIGDKRNYKIWVKEPELSENVVDLGLRMQPNLESLIKIKPDITIIPSFFKFHQNTLSQYSNVAVIDAYKDGNLYENLINATKEIAQLIGREKEAANLISRNEEIFKILKDKVKFFTSAPIAVVQFIDSKRLRIYGKNSIYGISLEKLGLINAIKDEFATNLWGIATIPLTALFHLPNNTRIVIIKPNPINIKHELKFNSIYRELKLFENRIELDPVWSAGAIASMQKFAYRLVFELKSQLK